MRINLGKSIEDSKDGSYMSEDPYFQQHKQIRETYESALSSNSAEDIAQQKSLIENPILEKRRHKKEQVEAAYAEYSEGLQYIAQFLTNKTEEVFHEDDS